jgi:hypothetical protein
MKWEGVKRQGGVRAGCSAAGRGERRWRGGRPDEDDDGDWRQSDEAGRGTKRRTERVKGCPRRRRPVDHGCRMEMDRREREETGRGCGIHIHHTPRQAARPRNKKRPIPPAPDGQTPTQSPRRRFVSSRLGRSTARQSHRPSLALASASVPFHSTPVHPRLQSSFKPATPGHHQLQLRRWEEEERRRAAGLHHEQQVAGLRNRLQPPASSRACAHLPAGAGYYSPASASASGEKPSQPWGACARGGCRRTRRRRRARWRPPTTRAA